MPQNMESQTKNPNFVLIPISDSDRRKQPLYFAFVQKMSVKTNFSNIFLSRPIRLHKLTSGFLLFPDNDSGEIMHLPING